MCTCTYTYSPQHTNLGYEKIIINRLEGKDWDKKNSFSVNFFYSKVKFKKQKNKQKQTTPKISKLINPQGFLDFGFLDLSHDDNCSCYICKKYFSNPRENKSLKIIGHEKNCKCIFCKKSTFNRFFYKNSTNLD